VNYATKYLLNLLNIAHSAYQTLIHCVDIEIGCAVVFIPASGLKFRPIVFYFRVISCVIPTPIIVDSWDIPTNSILIIP